MTNTNNELLKGIIIEKVREIKTDLFNELEEKFNAVIEKSENISSTNLKVYHINSYLYKLMEKSLISYNDFISIFEDITHFEYEIFTEWEKDFLKYTERKYIGRTSSFYYNTDIEMYYSGDAIQDILNNEHVTLENITGDLNSDTHDLLFDNNSNDAILSITNNYIEEVEIDNDLTFEDYLENLFESDIEILEELNNEVEHMDEIVTEALHAYSYLEYYKTEENEIEITKDYIKYYYLEQNIGNLGDKIYLGLLNELNPLNKLSYINLNLSEVNNSYVFVVETNLKTITYDTHIENIEDLTGDYILSVLDYLKELFNENFEF